MEALVGAIYLDRGFSFCRHFILRRLIEPHFDLDELSSTVSNHKSRIIEWAQKEDHDIRFEIIRNSEENKNKQFVAQVFIDQRPMEMGYGFSKKKAEQDAAQKTLEALKLSDS